MKQRSERVLLALMLILAILLCGCGGQQTPAGEQPNGEIISDPLEENSPAPGQEAPNQNEEQGAESEDELQLLIEEIPVKDEYGEQIGIHSFGRDADGNLRQEIWEFTGGLGMEGYRWCRTYDTDGNVLETEESWGNQKKDKLTFDPDTGTFLVNYWSTQGSKYVYNELTQLVETETVWYAEDGSQDSAINAIYQFDEAGNMASKQETSTWSDTDYSETWTYAYTPTGLMTKLRSVRDYENESQEDEESIWVYRYDEQDRLCMVYMDRHDAEATVSCYRFHDEWGSSVAYLKMELRNGKPYIVCEQPTTQSQEAWGDPDPIGKYFTDKLAAELGYGNYAEALILEMFDQA